MIKGVGIDVESVNRVYNSYDRHGFIFVEKIYHIQEIQYLNNMGINIQTVSKFLASRFAIKEALIKALGLNTSVIMPNEICMLADLKVKVFGDTEKECNKQNVTSIHASISYHENSVTAIVVLE